MRLFRFLIVVICCVVVIGILRADNEKALKDYEKKLGKVKEKDGKALAGLIKWCQKKKAFRRGRRLLAELKELSPDNKRIKSLESSLRGTIRSAPSPEVIGEYLEALHNAGEPVAKEYAKLGKWCDRRKLKEQAQQVFEKALELAPNNKDARKALGYYWVPPYGWLKGETAVKTAKGFRKVYDDWVPKAKAEAKAAAWDPPLELETEHVFMKFNVSEERAMRIVGIAERLFEILVNEFSLYWEKPEKFPKIIIGFVKDRKCWKDVMGKIAPSYANRESYYEGYPRLTQYICDERNEAGSIASAEMEAISGVASAVVESFFQKAGQPSRAHYWVVMGMDEYCRTRSFGKYAGKGSIEKADALRRTTCSNVQRLLVSKSHIPLKKFFEFTNFDLNVPYERVSQACTLFHMLFAAENGIYREKFAQFIKAVYCEDVTVETFEKIIGLTPQDAEKKWLDFARRLN